MDQMIANVEALSAEQVKTISERLRESIRRRGLLPAITYLHASLMQLARVKPDERVAPLLARCQSLHSRAAENSTVPVIRLDEGEDAEGVCFAPPGKSEIHVWMVILAAESREAVFYFHPKYEEQLDQIKNLMYMEFIDCWNYSSNLIEAQNTSRVMYQILLNCTFDHFTELNRIRDDAIGVYPELAAKIVMGENTQIKIPHSGDRLCVIMQYA